VCGAENAGGRHIHKSSLHQEGFLCEKVTVNFKILVSLRELECSETDRKKRNRGIKEERKKLSQIYKDLDKDEGKSK
jgi:hypothetical protein